MCCFERDMENMIKLKISFFQDQSGRKYSEFIVQMKVHLNFTSYCEVVNLWFILFFALFVLDSLINVVY